MQTENKVNVYFIHFGCRLNQYESTAMESAMMHDNINIVSDAKEADYIIMNTCTVTNRADQKTRQAIRKVHRSNPMTKIIVTGCYASTDPEEIQALPGVYAIIPNVTKSSIPKLINPEYQHQFHQLSQTQFRYTYHQKTDRARAYIKIQDGCNKKCSYCKIPQARGKQMSRDINDILQEAHHLVNIGFHELVLTGVNIGCYKYEGISFYELLKALLKIPGDFYIRISSIEPGDVNLELAQILMHEKMAKFLHVPLQSGSKMILKWMNRGYTPQQFIKNITQVRKLVPTIHIGTDIILGFPGESNEYFQETFDMCKELSFANIHIFPYSERKHTSVLAKIDNDKYPNIYRISRKIIKERVAKLQLLRTLMQKTYQKNTTSLVFRAIIESVDKNRIKLVSENYVKYHMSTSEECQHHKGDLLYVRGYEKLSQIPSKIQLKIR